MDPFRCPIHGIPDCSPLLNGCSVPNKFHEALEARTAELGRLVVEAHRQRAEVEQDWRHAQHMVVALVHQAGGEAFVSRATMQELEGDWELHSWTNKETGALQVAIRRAPEASGE